MLSPSDVVCPICLDIFIEPVTLCCSHELCKICYEEHFLKADFRCPMCKKRLSSWARKAAQTDTLVNVTKWNAIQEQFHDIVEKKRNGEDTYQLLIPTALNVTQPGEVHKEYMQQKQEWEDKQREMINEEEDASMNLIKQILLEEKLELERKRNKQLEEDKELATLISSELNQTVSPEDVNTKLLRSLTSSLKKTPKGKTNKPSLNSLDRYFSPTRKRSNSEDTSNLKNCTNVAKRLKVGSYSLTSQCGETSNSSSVLSDHHEGDFNVKENLSPS